MSSKLVITISGGGSLGCGPIRYLKLLDEQSKIGATAYGGTSTGAIIAALLAFGKTPAEADTLFNDKVGAIFGSKRIAWTLFKKGGKYDAKPLESILSGVLGDTKFKDLKTDLYILSWDVVTRSLVIFSKKNTPEQLVRFAVRCSVAAPTYFMAVSNRYIDGGLGANDPAAVVLSQAILDDVVGSDAKVLNLVTSGDTPDSKTIDDNAFVLSQLTGEILPAITSGNSSDIELTLKAFRQVTDGKVQYYRVCPTLPDFDMDDISKNPQTQKAFSDQFALDQVSVTEFVRPSL